MFNYSLLVFFCFMEKDCLDIIYMRNVDDLTRFFCARNSCPETNNILRAYGWRVGLGMEKIRWIRDFSSGATIILTYSSPISKGILRTVKKLSFRNSHHSIRDDHTNFVKT